MFLLVPTTNSQTTNQNDNYSFVFRNQSEVKESNSAIALTNSKFQAHKTLVRLQVQNSSFLYSLKHGHKREELQVYTDVGQWSKTYLLYAVQSSNVI